MRDGKAEEGKKEEERRYIDEIHIVHINNQLHTEMDGIKVQIRRKLL